ILAKKLKAVQNRRNPSPTVRSHAIEKQSVEDADPHDFQLLTAAIIRKIMWIGIFYALLLYGVTPDGGGWIPAILNSFQLLGQNASSVGPLGPSAIVGFGVNTAVDLLSAASDAGFLTNMGNALTLGFCAVVIFIAYLAIAIQFVVALVESYLVIGGGCILLG